MMRVALCVALLTLSCASDPMTAAPIADAGAEAGGDAALPSLEGTYTGQLSFRARDLSPVSDPSPNGGPSGPGVASIAGERLDLGRFMPRCTVRVVPQSPTVALVDSGRCEGDTRDPWRGQYTAALLVLRPGATLAIGGGRIVGTLEWDFTGTIDRQQPNAGMAQRGVVVLNVDLTRAP